MTTLADYMHRRSERAPGAPSARLEDHFSTSPNGNAVWAVLGIAAAAMVLAAGYKYSPDLFRYLKIKRM